MARNFASGNYLQVPSDVAFDGSVATIAFWMKTTQSGVNGGLVSRWSSSSRSGLAILTTTANKINLAGYDASTSRISGATSTTSINNGNWHHVAALFDRTTAANGNKVYIDGTFEAQATSSAAWPITGQIIRVADFVDSFWSNYVGDMAEIGWWSQQLTADEIYALSKGASPQRVRPAALELHIPCWA